jgi:hypothetical protein
MTFHSTKAPRPPLHFILLLSVVIFVGCQTVPQPPDPARVLMNAAILRETPGNYFFGRRMFKKDYKMWGWVREPGMPWKSAKLVMMNEQRMIAPDRASGKLGVDNNYDYRLEGAFSGDMVYEPASDKFYPEFVLTGYELIRTNPPSIYIVDKQLDPAIRIINTPVE